MPCRELLAPSASPSHKGHRYPVEVIAHCVRLSFRFPLSFREVEELMPERGVLVSHETVRRWCAKFGQAYANGLRRCRYLGQAKAHLQHVLTAIDVNIERLSSQPAAEEASSPRPPTAFMTFLDHNGLPRPKSWRTLGT
ncbi:transposase [Streptomyces prasinus]